MSKPDNSDTFTLLLNQPHWIAAAKRNNVDLKYWASKVLDEASFQKVCGKKLDAIIFKDFYCGDSPYFFQVLSLRSWVGVTQNEAAGITGLPINAYRSCESNEGKVGMEPSLWIKYLEKAAKKIFKVDPIALPNCFARAIKGLVCLNYKNLSKASSLSQSYWTTRLRTKKTPLAIEVYSIVELIGLAVKEIDKKYSKGLYDEATAMLSSLLFLSYHTQLAQVESDPLLQSPMQTYKKINKSGKEQKLHGVYMAKGDIATQVNLYELTLAVLKQKGYQFSENHPDTLFMVI